MTQPIDRERLTYLASLISDGVIVEIGSFRGASTCAIASKSKVPVYAIDMWDLTYIKDRRTNPDYIGGKIQSNPENYNNFMENIKIQGLQRKIIPIKGISFEIAKAWNRPIGMLFIDGDHSYKGCIGDYKGFAKYIISGGVLAVHDYNNRHPGIIQAIDEIKNLELWIDWEVVGTTISARRK